MVLEDAQTGRHREVSAAALFILIGAAPRTDWLPEALQRDAAGYVVSGQDVATDAWTLARSPIPLETSIPGVFAAGDIRRGSVKRVASAVGEGSVAVRMVHEYLAGLTA